VVRVQAADLLFLDPTTNAPTILTNGRCFKPVACGNRGSCVDGREWIPACTCSLGFQGGDRQCDECSKSFWGPACDPCPGEGLVARPAGVSLERHGHCRDAWAV
jgi:hypothetical protein